MSIALIASDPISLGDLVHLLNQEGVAVHSCSLEASLKCLSDGSFEKAVLIVAQHGAGAQIEKVRSTFGTGRHLILCSPQPSNADRQLLLELGADEVITPRTWHPTHSAERILAQLILEREIQPSSHGGLQGATKMMQNLYRDIETVSPLSDTVLILGETGTGKELIAREIHRLSGRSDNFIALNCAELSVELSGSDLFGHKKGSFTGATETRHGLLAEAGGGTAFFDEIGEFDLSAQAKLLRVLEDKTVRRVGSNTWEMIHARFILATNRDLEGECQKGTFRTDLFHHINDLTLKTVPLREHLSDIPLLVEHFVAEFNREYNQSLRVPSSALDRLFEYQWPGNVRELRGIVRKAAAYADQTGYINAVRLQEATRHRLHSSPLKNSVEFDVISNKWRDVLNRAQLAYFTALLNATSGNKEEAAKRAGLSRSQFYEKLKEINSK
jgi:DNA-binding NtrC family response regulator